MLVPSAAPSGSGVPTGPVSQPTFSPSARISSPPPSSTTAPETHPTATTNITPQFEPIDLSSLIINNCQLVRPVPFKLASSIRDGRWSAHATSGRSVFLSASGDSLQGALEVLHRKSAEEVDGYVTRMNARTPVTIGEYEEPSEDEESDSEEEEEEEEQGDVPWGSFSKPYGCCGCDGSRPRTRLLPVTGRPSRMPFKRVPPSSILPPPPPLPPPEAPCPPPPPPPPSTCPIGPRVTTSHTANRPSETPMLLVISWGADKPRRILKRVPPSLQAIERVALRAVREAAPDSAAPAAAKVRGVGVGEAESFEVDGFGDDLSEVFGEGIPRVYVDVRGRDEGGSSEGGGLSLARPLGQDEDRKAES